MCLHLLVYPCLCVGEGRVDPHDMLLESLSDHVDVLERLENELDLRGVPLFVFVWDRVQFVLNLRDLGFPCRVELDPGIDFRDECIEFSHP